MGLILHQPSRTCNDFPTIMAVLIAFLITFLLLIFSVFQGVFIAYPLFLSMTIFMGIWWLQGFPIQMLLKMAWKGSQKSFSVIFILLLIGVVTAVWMAAGTVPSLVYYGLQWVNPQYFIVMGFGLSSLVSLLIGTSFGTVSTIGIALMIMADGSGINPHIIAGAIIAGAYVGDRCSPMSSSAHLIATVTQTQLYTNIKNMWKTSIFPLSFSLLIYGVLSRLHPVSLTDETFSTTIRQTFQIHWIVLAPALVIFALSLAQVEVKRSMLLSVGVAIALACFYQHYSVLDLLQFMAMGFQLEESNPLAAILRGGGLVSMAKVSLVVIISTAFVGLFTETHTLRRLESWLSRERSRSGCFLNTCLVGIGTAAFGCTQTIAILLTQELVESKYKEKEKGDYKLALDLENTVVVISPLIPWNIAGLVPATILHTDLGFIPYAVYLYLIPVVNLIYLRLKKPPRRMLCN